METLERLLLAHPFLAGIDPQFGRLLVGCAKNVRFAAGEFLFHESDPADEFYLIREGMVALEVSVPGRAPLVISTIGEGDLVGASWLVAPYRWNSDARATTPVRAFSLDAACLRRKSEEDHHLGYEMMKRLMQVMVNRMHAARQQLLDVYGTAPA